MRQPHGKNPSLSQSLRRSLSIQQRLPILICVLLVCMIAAFSWLSYVGMRKSAMVVGRERLTNLSQQLSSMFDQAAAIQIAAIPKIADLTVVKDYLLTDTSRREEARKSLQKLTWDTLFPFVELLTREKITVLDAGKSPFQEKVNVDSALKHASVAPVFGTVGKIVTVSDSMYYPIIAAVRNADTTIGYIVRWRILTATRQTLEQLSQFMGTNATLYFVNRDGSLWTDMMNPVAKPPVQPGFTDIVEYERAPGYPVLAASRPIANSDWFILVELSTNKILEGTHQFLNWMLVAGGLLTAAGIVIAWIMSRNITRPLHSLTRAATKIAEGSDFPSVNVSRRDELGTLANAFNTMSLQIQNARKDLEQKVIDRTKQLESVNKELEAFSYSVSHDLRSPLRAIGGYSTILQEDFESLLGDEGKRIIGAIHSNTKMMGKLIDDLLAFSKMGKKELSLLPIDMKTLAESCMTELQGTERAANNPLQFHCASLPACAGDPGMMKQVWMNLIGNAIKYSSQQQEPRIEIACVEEPSRNVYSVRDNGVGFDMQYAHKLFGVFQRLHSAEAFEGTGIGLALVKRIVHKHNGDVWAESTPGAGASFYFSIPKLNGHG